MVSLKENHSVQDLMTCRSFTHRVPYRAAGWMKIVWVIVLYKRGKGLPGERGLRPSKTTHVCQDQALKNKY